jgi:hypothetical protein
VPPPSAKRYPNSNLSPGTLNTQSQRSIQAHENQENREQCEAGAQPGEDPFLSEARPYIIVQSVNLGGELMA